jgi:diaminopropionate ammonia-lyase
MMAGLNCGTLSAVAWPWLENGLDAVVTVGDERAAEAMRRLSGLGIVSGESGAAGLAGLSELLLGPGSAENRTRLGWAEGSRVLLLSTEGITDAENYGRVVDRRGKPQGRFERGVTDDRDP